MNSPVYIKELLLGLTGVAWGVAWKLLLLGAVAIVLMIGAKWYRAHAVKEFCATVSEGEARAQLQERASRAGLTVHERGSRDEIIHEGLGWGLAWCFVQYSNSRVDTARFASE